MAAQPVNPVHEFWGRYESDVLSVRTSCSKPPGGLSPLADSFEEPRDPGYAKLKKNEKVF